MKKFKVLILSIILTIIISYSLLSGSLNLLQSFLIVSVISYLFTYWVLDFDIDKLGPLTLLLFPTLMISAVSIMLLVYTPNVLKFLNMSNLFTQNILIIIVFLFLITITTYSSIISMNIFNVSRYKRLPLLQAAQTIVYTYTVIGGYISFTLLHHFFLSQWYLLLIFYLLVCIYLFFINTWSIKLPAREMINFTLIGALIVTELGLVLLTFPLAQYVFTIAITACVYIYNGIITHIDKRNLLRRISLEYGTIALIVSLLIVFTTHWGIAGNILGK